MRYFKQESSWGIITFNVKNYLDESEVMDVPNKSAAKGTMPEPSVGGEYIIEAREVIDPKWGRQFDIIRMYKSILLNENDKVGQRNYLESLFTEGQVKSMYESLEDPYEVLLSNNVEKLVQVKGCGLKTARLWLSKFHDDLDKSRVFVELASYNLSPFMVSSLLEFYGSPDIVIDKVQHSPYSLIDVPGIGWKKCNEIAGKGGLPEYCTERVEAFLKYYLQLKAEEGYTYLYANEQLMQAILENLGDGIPDEPITEALHKMGDRLKWSDDHSVIGLKRYLQLEQKIAQKLIELRDAPNKFKYDKWEEVIKQKEGEQGWSYTEQQREGIKATLENQVVIITGYGGTGKSSIVAGMIEVLKNYNFAQCALSGRAAARLAEVTHKEGYTIHRLLGYPKGPREKHRFSYHDECLLPQQIIIVDEISMVSGDLFWSLIRALRPGTKLILLGDVGQLESIGCCNIAMDLIESGEIKSVVLDKIHRQAAASAIITESIEARNGRQTIKKDFAGIETRGELQDLTYDCYSDMNNTFFKVLEYASNLKEKRIHVKDVQVIVPIKERQSGTWNLNLALQEIYNPLDGREQLIVSYDKDKVSAFRVGDKVINIQNNYESCEYPSGDICPVFNGNMGIVLKIDTHKREMVVDYIGIGKVLITSKMLKNTMLGYAVTVHKCQGSEFPYVIFGMDFSSYSLLSRQLVYTAITRASKHCYVIAQTAALRYAISQNKVSEKQTMLQNDLYQAAYPML